MNNLKKFEEFDWTFGLGKNNPSHPEFINKAKRKTRRPSDPNTIPPPKGYNYTGAVGPMEEEDEPYVDKDQALFDKIESKIRNNFKIENLIDCSGDGITGKFSPEKASIVYKLGSYTINFLSNTVSTITVEDQYGDKEELHVDREKLYNLKKFIIVKKIDSTQPKKGIIRDKFYKDLDELTERKRIR